MSHNLQNRIALITGASRGIGQAVAVRFAKEGAQVIAGARDVKGLEETDDLIRADGSSATLVEIDLTDTSKIEVWAQQVAARFGKLDILVGNAASLGEISPLSDQSPYAWDKVMATNLTANFHLIRCFDGLLKQSDAPRAIFVTSGVTEIPAAYWGAYAVSKSALESMVNIYAAENAKAYPDFKINLIDPGAVRTRLRAQVFPGEDPEQLPEPEAITEIFVTLAGLELKETGRKFSPATSAA
ncbi:MAG: SDR family NAD(P)-dependent oxidoreductase [Pseudomonadota bacterium]|nr:SDR family NAD(P)-dependent oxidoreductase [Pseudomonadota bacterium]MDE3037820.1 SDR family NAD(P)-dependent oxidoreductase [Pseudomonadota bacterium]